MIQELTVRRVVSAIAVAGVLMLAGCGDEPKPVEVKKEVKKPAVPEGNVPALTAYYDVYKVARTLAPDLQTASVTANEVDGVKSEAGKYSQWTIVFVSATNHMAYTYLYSTVEKANILKGINSQGSMRWAGPTQNATPFANGDFSVDSDAAYTAAATKAKDWLAKNPGKPVSTLALGNSARFPSPMWYVKWGDNKSGGYEAYVNAATGNIFGK